MSTPWDRSTQPASNNNLVYKGKLGSHHSLKIDKPNKEELELY